MSTGDGGFNHLYFSATCRYSSTVSFTRFLGPVAGPSRRRDPVGQPGAPPLLPSGGAPVISGPVKINYFLASFFGLIPSMFILNTIGAGLNSYIEQAETFSMIDFIITPEIYLPIFMFAILMLFSIVIKKKFFDGANK